MSKDFENPIDPDKVTDRPGLVEYAHHVGSAVIKPLDRGKLKGRAMAAMYEQSDLQLAQIKDQIDLLAKQARKIQERRMLSEEIYETGLRFEPVIGKTYYFYEKPDGEKFVSMLSPGDWGNSKTAWTLLAPVKLLGDHTWEILPMPQESS